VKAVYAVRSAPGNGAGRAGGPVLAIPLVPIELDDVVRLKKPHACGGNAWRIVKLGMDIGLECTQCGRKVRLERREFDRRFRGYLSRASDSS